MSFFVAAMWAVSARLFTTFIALILVSARHVEDLDLVSLVLCQGVAFLGTLYFVVLVHDPDRALSDVLGLRRTRVSLCVVAVALGFALQGPLTLISDAIYKRYPLSEAELEHMRFMFTAPAMHQKVALVAAGGILG